jgi:hypothetical protein
VLVEEERSVLRGQGIVDEVEKALLPVIERVDLLLAEPGFLARSRRRSRERNETCRSCFGSPVTAARRAR